MADLNFTVNADTGGAQRNLQNLERSVGGLSSTFSGLTNVFAAFAGAISVRAIANITSGFTDLQSRLKNATGSAEEASRVFDRLSDTARNTYSSIEQTSESFLRNNLALRSLGYTTEQQLQISEALNNALAISGTKGQQASSVMNALSKAFASGSLSGENLNSVIENGGKITEILADALGVLPGQLREVGRAGELDTARVIDILISKSKELAKEAGEMPATINDGFVLLQNSVSNLVGTFDSISGGSGSIASVMERLADSIDGFTASLKTNSELVKDVIDLIKNLAIVLGSLFILSRIITVVATFSTTAAMARTGLVSFIGALTGLTSVVDKAKQGWYLLTSFVLGFKNILTGSASVVAGVAALTGAFVKLVPLLGVVYTAFEVLNFALKRWTEDGIVGWADRAGKAIADLFDIEYKTAKEKEALAKQQEQWNNAELDRFKRLAQQQQQQNEAVTTNIDLLKKQREEVAKIVDGYKQSNDQQLKQLQREIELVGLTEQQTTVKQALFDLEDRRLREIARLQDMYNEKSKSGKDEDIKALPLIKAAMEQVTAEYNAQLEPVLRLTQEKLKSLEVEKQRIELERQANNLAEFTNKSRLDTERQIRDIQNDIAKSTMTELEKKYYDIAEASKESARAAIESENARRRAINQPLLTTDEQSKYYEAAAAGNEELIRQTQRHFEQSRSWATGWKQAFNEYIDNATNAAQQAQSVFSKATKGMEDAIVNFAKTGKFEFKNFVTMILEELLRIQIQRTFANLFGGGAGGSNQSSVVGSLGNLLGFANGGIIPTDRPVLVGERGPELLVGASGNRVIANDQLTGSNVTYNINAVDASSFKEMVARDPSFLYAVTEQGRRRAPGTRR